jgi:microcystin-dependent protein
MASTYSDLKIELIGTGEQVGTWGSTTNTNLGTAIEEAIVGTASVSFSSADVTLTLTNTNGTQAARHLRLNLTGTSGGARNLILGSGCQIDKPYIINNGLADAVTVKNTTGTGVAVPAGKSMWVYNNGTNVVEVITHVNATVTGNVTGNLTGNVTGNATNVSGTVAVANGGTGATTLTANNVILGNGTSAVQFVAPGTSGNLLTSNGTVWQSSTPTFVPAGVVLYFAASSAPTGYLKANGANVSRSTYAALFSAIGTTFGAGDGATTFGLPDLRGEFIRGWDDSRGVDSGRAFGSAQGDLMRNHTHNYFISQGSIQWTGDPGSGAQSLAITNTDVPNGGLGGAENRPRNVALLACIKF